MKGNTDFLDLWGSDELSTDREFESLLALSRENCDRSI